MNEVIKDYIDKGIAFVEKHKEYLMYGDDIAKDMIYEFDYSSTKNKSSKMELEQENASGELLELLKSTDKVWKATNSSVTDSQIIEIEEYFNLTFPNSYKEYLKYKHFYTIFLNSDIRLFSKPTDKWKEILVEANEEMREVLLDKGYFAIGYYSDYGAVCFDFRNNKEEASIVFITYEDLQIELLSENFTHLLEQALELKEPTLKELKPWKKKMYGIE
ncbi:SMI1/KNR4 family protein [Flavobacterium sp. N502540]|uniref:SMI1/KNR4 family protein n=1 Tax=Flavobacterium sp. N502540 TaxID=2986838 RepID=UPI0022249A5A|nr:SMI1/KNR4 family protein [Flavobacterium sp. N502540]